MSKNSKIEFEGVVTEVLPNTMFRVTLNLENKPLVLCTLSGRMKTNNINVLLNDKVTVEVSPYDLSRGRITFRKK